MTRNPWIQGVFLIIAALVFAVVANGFASRERRLVLPGYYPDARTVPAAPAEQPGRRVAEPPGPPITPAPQVATETIAPARTTTTAPATATAPPIPRRLGDSTTRPLAPQPAPAPIDKFPPHPDKAYIEISGDDAASLHAKGALFLDARRTSVYEQGHIAGARPFSVWESDIDDKIAKLFEERGDPSEQARPIVVYCTGGACEDSHMLSQKLWLVQFNNVYVYKDGFPDWQKRGGAVKSGAQP